MKFNRLIWIGIFGLVSMVIVAIVSRPSETRLLESFVDRVIEGQRRHADVCPHCNLIATRQQLIEIVRTQQIGEPTNLQYHNYLLFSTLTTGSSANINAIGFFGLALGPEKTGVPVCLGEVVMPEPIKPGEMVVPDDAFRIAIDSAGVVSVDGNVVTNSELLEMLEKSVQAGNAKVVIEAERKTKFRDLDILKKIILDSGYDEGVIVQVGVDKSADK